MITGPFLLIAFVISISILLIAIIRFRLNPFIALLTTSILTGFLVRMPLIEIAGSMSRGFGNTFGAAMAEIIVLFSCIQLMICQVSFIYLCRAKSVH